MTPGKVTMATKKPGIICSAPFAVFSSRWGIFG
jgi:hypothetical protein